MSLSINKAAGGSDLAGALFKALDKNGDQKISSSEFQTFINALLGGQTSPTVPSSTIGSAALNPSTAAASGSGSSNAPTTPQIDPNAGFAWIQGFDYGKLQDLTHQTQKYSPAVRVFSQVLYATGANAAASRDNLQPVVDQIKQRGFPNAKTVGDDSIDFGDGVGPIDVITGSNQWWFGQPF